MFLSTLCLLASLFYVNEPVIDMRETPALGSKVVSQTVFAEEVTIQKTADDWSFITTPDGYVGWVLSKVLVSRSEPYDPQLKTSRLKAHLYGVKDTEYGPIKSLPYGSKLKAIEETDARWVKVALPDGVECYIQRGDVAIEKEQLYKNTLPQWSLQFLGLPYTWGGRSSFGYDCSGFVQMLYRQIGIHLQRDSKQQILDSRLQWIELDQLEPGDLLFFGKSAQKIMHVGLYIGNGQFIHATAQENMPWIRISNLSDFTWSGHKDAYYPYRTARQLIKTQNNAI